MMPLFEKIITSHVNKPSSGGSLSLSLFRECFVNGRKTHQKSQPSKFFKSVQIILITLNPNETPQSSYFSSDESWVVQNIQRCVRSIHMSLWNSENACPFSSKLKTALNGKKKSLKWPNSTKQKRRFERMPFVLRSQKWDKTAKCQGIKKNNKILS